MEKSVDAGATVDPPGVAGVGVKADEGQENDRSGVLLTRTIYLRFARWDSRRPTARTRNNLESR